MLPTINIGDVFTFLGNLIKTAFVIWILKFILVAFAIILFPWCIEMGWRMIMKVISVLVEAVIGSNEQIVKNPVVAASGAFGFFMSCFRVPECFANITSGLIVAFTLSVLSRFE